MFALSEEERSHDSDIQYLIQMKDEDMRYPQTGGAITEVQTVWRKIGQSSWWKTIVEEMLSKCLLKAAEYSLPTVIGKYSTVQLQQSFMWLSLSIGPHARELYEPLEQLSVPTSASAPPPACHHVSVQHLLGIFALESCMEIKCFFWCWFCGCPSVVRSS